MVKKGAEQLCFQLKYQQAKVFFRFHVSPTRPLWLSSGDSIIWLLHFHQSGEAPREDAEVMRLFLLARTKGENNKLSTTPASFAIHLPTFICLLDNLLLNSVQAVTRQIVSGSVDRCCSAGVSATVRSRFSLTFDLENINTPKCTEKI